MADRNEKNILEKGVDKVKDVAASVKDTVKEGYDQLVGNSHECDDQCVKKCPYVQEKEEGGVIMDKGYWDDKGMYYQGPGEDQVLYPG